MKKYITVLLFSVLMFSVFSCKAEEPTSDLKTIANSSLQAVTTGSSHGNMLIGIDPITITDGVHDATPVVVTAPTEHTSISIDYLKSIVANTLFQEFGDEISGVSTSITLGTDSTPPKTATATATLTAQTGYVFENGGSTKVITIALSTEATGGFVDIDVIIPNTTINITTDKIEATATAQGIDVITITGGGDVTIPVDISPVTTAGVKTINVDKIAISINYNLAQKYIVPKGLIANVQVTVAVASPIQALATITLTAQSGHTFENGTTTKVITVALKPSATGNVFVDNTTILNSDVNFTTEAVVATANNIGMTAIAISIPPPNISATATQKTGVAGIVNVNTAAALIKTQVNNAANFPANVDKELTEVNLSYIFRMERSSPPPSAASGSIVLTAKAGYKFEDGSTSKEFFMFLML